MAKHARLIRSVFLVVLCLMVVLSILDTRETRYETNFDQDNILTHIENLTENGPRSIADTQANRKAVTYITETLESFGLVNADTTDVPAYQVQPFVAEDTDYQNWYLDNVIVHIPANAAEPTGQAQMFMGYFDSVPMGPGASDDGVAVSVMLEAIRYYLGQMEQGFTMANDLMFCFVNGEEYGLYGSAAFMTEFDGFNNVVERIRFGTNLESRGTSGTLIMFETAANNLNTVKLFSEINDNVFTCSIATMIYGMMPNGTDFSSFKHAYQGVNMANITGGENYHTQNDSFENVGETYPSQQAMIVDAIIEKLANYDLDLLHEADGSAVFFSYLNAATVVYNSTVSLVLALALIALIIINVVLATSALGLTMAYVFGVVFALGIFPAGVFLAERRPGKASALAGLAVALAIFLTVSLCKPNASINLQGKQNLAKLPWDDALVYVADERGDTEYRIYDLNALPYLEGFAPEMTYTGDYYAAPGEAEIAHSIRSSADGNVLTIQKAEAASLVYLTFTDIQAESFTIDDGTTSNTYFMEGSESYGITLHTDCTVTLNGGSAEVAYQEVLRDYDALIPQDAPENLHFNLWLTGSCTLDSGAN